VSGHLWSVSQLGHPIGGEPGGILAQVCLVLHARAQGFCVVLALMTDPDAVGKILRRLGLPFSAPALAPARSSGRPLGFPLSDEDSRPGMRHPGQSPMRAILSSGGLVSGCYSPSAEGFPYALLALVADVPDGLARSAPARARMRCGRMAAAMRMTRIQATLLALVVAQAAHSIEECSGRLYEVFAPARFASGLISQDPRRGFLVINAALVAFGLWCVFWPIRRHWRSAAGLIWFWIAIELVNGVGHSLWSLVERRYTPGVGTALVLVLLSAYLARQQVSALRRSRQGV